MGWENSVKMTPFTYSVGASYLVRQAPGSERIGGLRVTVRQPPGNAGTITVDATDWRTGAALERPAVIEPYVSEAIRVIREVADEYGFRLDEFDVVLSDFVVHPVDSVTRCYYQAGKSAFRSALEAWKTGDLSTE
jgi:hypothetical protein